MLQADGKLNVGGLCRVLEFPAERSIGDIALRDVRVANSDWELFTDACGLITIPVNNVVRLKIFGGSSEVKELHSLPQNGLYSLDISNCELTDNDLERVAHLTSLRELNLDMNPFITTDGISKLSRLRRLKTLTLGHTNVNDDIFPSIENFNRIQTLSLGFTGITGTSLKSIGLLSRIQWLWLTNTPVTDEGLCSLLPLRSLAWLRLTGTQITDASVATLASMESLRWLWIGQTRITERGRLEIERKLTGCDVRNE